MRIFVSGLVLAGAIWIALPGMAQAEPKCSRNADELTGAMVSMMPDGRYCEMEDSARTAAEAEIAAYNRAAQVGNREAEALADADKSGSALTGSNNRNGNWSGTVFSRSFERAKEVCLRTGKPESFCGADSARLVENHRNAAMTRCTSKGMTYAQCRVDVENTQYFNYYY